MTLYRCVLCTGFERSVLCTIRCEVDCAKSRDVQRWHWLLRSNMQNTFWLWKGQHLYVSACLHGNMHSAAWKKKSMWNCPTKPTEHKGERGDEVERERMGSGATARESLRLTARWSYWERHAWRMKEEWRERGGQTKAGRTNGRLYVRYKKEFLTCLEK